jgi:8-hydroxy-5-deazaflavin:NADPH oxidoreductase
VLDRSIGPIAILGGTGLMGLGLARRWARAGCTVILGSRDRDKAVKAAAGVAGAQGAGNVEAARAAEIAVLTVPFEHQKSTLELVKNELAGKILVDVTVPLVPPKVSTVQLPPEGSAALRAQAILGGEVRVVSAFQNVSAKRLHDDHPIDCDVLVAGDDPAAREAVIALAKAAGLRALHAGALANSAAAEALTSVLIAINRRYKIDGAGIRVTGLGES